MHRSLAGLALLPFLVLAAPIHAGEPDTTAPTINGLTLKNTASGTLVIPVPATDDVALGEAVATIDDAPAASATYGGTTSGTVTLSIDTTKYANGKHDVEIHVTDAAGNRSSYGIVMTVTFENVTVTPEATATPTVQQPHDRPTPTPTPTPTPLGEIGILGDEATRYTSRDFLSLPKRPRASKAGTLTLTARCPLPKTCSLNVRLTRAGKTFGTGRVTVKSKKTGKLSIKLTRSARAAVKKKPQTLRLTVAGYAGVVITLR
ncbi:hypothetical protein C8N24_1572 [Solirubrobacter pauli]|uniref:Ig-like domain-containing protein n=1 Tax=Solirubrobacter pauli TaxID=166793 RepID=A0A660LFP9_9ACTN|nr:hypothetical protein [Solirubrobacter pauli]RKQ91744.1 hypothetical protein C8N24_1572 [Solirubrobacter pauli]